MKRAGRKSSAQRTLAFLCFAIFTIAAANTSFFPNEKLTAFDAAAEDLYGASVAISNGIIVVGAYGDSDNGTFTGAVYLYTSNGGTWDFTKKLTAPDAAARDVFGYSVAISNGVVAVGSPGDSDNGTYTGAVYLYTSNGGTWDFTQKLTAPDAAEGDAFGYSVAISNGVVAVGSVYDDDNGTNSGSVYLYTSNGGTWDFTQKLIAPDGASDDQYGASVAISNGVVTVGSPGDSDNGTYTGAVYLYTSNGGTWNFTQKLTAFDGAADKSFGFSVAISNRVAVVGSPGDSDKGASSGSVYLYTSNGGTWDFTQKLTAPDGEARDLFGMSLAISNGTIVVASRNDDDNGTDSGSAYLYTNNGGAWDFTQKITAFDAAAGDLFGYSVAISNGVAVLGAPHDSDSGATSGSAYTFSPCPTGIVYSGGVCVCPIADQVFNGTACVACEGEKVPNEDKTACVDAPATTTGSEADAAAPLGFILDLLF